MHPFHDYLCQQLDDMLKKHGVVVFYDPRREFELFFDRELKEEGTGYDGLPRVFVKERLTFIVRFEGSFFALRAAVEPIADLDKPEALIVYLPGVGRDRQGSVLMELEKGGICYEPQLKRLARNLLRARFTDGDIDEMLRSEHVTYGDIAGYLDQGPAPSRLKSIIDAESSEEMIVRWLGDETLDAEIRSKDAVAELHSLLDARLGMSQQDDETLSETRLRVARYVLLNEFRSDLHCDPPDSIAMIPSPDGKDHMDRIRTVATRVRRDYAEGYTALSDQIQDEMRLVDADIPPEALGNIDTFRFEERRLLGYANGLVAGGEYATALRLVEDRRHSFWTDREIARQVQWEVCRLAAELGSVVASTLPEVQKFDGQPGRWVDAYSARDGWHRTDRLHRLMETMIANLDQEPEMDRGIAMVRRAHDDLVKEMAERFTLSVQSAGWAVEDVVSQRRVYSDFVNQGAGTVAYFWVDALRFEMGIELAAQLSGVEDLQVRAALSAIPSITSLGMAALLPGASASYSVVEKEGKLAAKVDGAVLRSLSDRQQFLKSRVPEAVDLTLGKVLHTSSNKLSALVQKHPVVVVRSQEIDFAGETDRDLLARQVMEGMISNLVRGVRRLAAAGVQRFIVTADHGHLFAERRDEDMRTDNPGGKIVEIHRRCWAGYGGTTPPGTLRVTGAELGYDTDLDFVFPRGLGVFKTPGALSYHHGGISLQELVIPVITCRVPAATAAATTGPTVSLSGVPDAITNRALGGLRLTADEDLFAESVVLVRVELRAPDGGVAGAAGMAVGANFDATRNVVELKPGCEASVGLMLMRDDCEKVKIVVYDPVTDAVLTQTKYIPLRLGI